MLSVETFLVSGGNPAACLNDPTRQRWPERLFHSALLRRTASLTAALWRRAGRAIIAYHLYKGSNIYCVNNFFKSSQRQPLASKYFIYMAKLGLGLNCVSKVLFCPISWFFVRGESHNLLLITIQEHYHLSLPSFPHLARYPPPAPVHPSRSFIFYRGLRCSCQIRR